MTVKPTEKHFAEARQRAISNDPEHGSYWVDNNGHWLIRTLAQAIAEAEARGVDLCPVDPDVEKVRRVLSAREGIRTDHVSYTVGNYTFEAALAAFKEVTKND